MNEQYVVRELLKAKDILMGEGALGEPERIKLLWVVANLAAELDLTLAHKLSNKTTIV